MESLIETILAAISAEDDRAKELMASGNLQSFDEYRFSGGYRRALADVQKIIQQEHEAWLKE